MEEPEAPRFILTGSSARKLRRGGVDLLAGRAIVATMHRFMASEVADAAASPPCRIRPAVTS
jgi:uncharacterized protein